MIPHRTVDTPLRSDQLVHGRRSIATPRGLLAQRRLERVWRQGLPAFSLYLARQLRSGATLEQALVEVIGDIDTPDRVSSVGRQLSAGRPLTDVLDEWSETAEGTEELLVAALRLGPATGAPMARSLEGVATALRDDRELDDRRRVWLAQAQMSAAVLVALPVLFAMLSSALRGRFVYGDRIGVVVLIVGLTLDGVGILWIRRLLRRLR